MRQIKALALGLALLAGGSLVTAQTASARWGGGWHGGWHGGGFGWGGAALGFGLGIAAAAAFGGPYYYGGYGYPYAGYYGYPAAYPAYYGGGCHLARRWGPYGPHWVRICY